MWVKITKPEAQQFFLYTIKRDVLPVRDFDKENYRLEFKDLSPDEQNTFISFVMKRYKVNQAMAANWLSNFNIPKKYASPVEVCPNCKEILQEEAFYCPSCGEALAPQPQKETPQISLEEKPKPASISIPVSVETKINKEDLKSFLTIFNHLNVKYGVNKATITKKGKVKIFFRNSDKFLYIALSEYLPEPVPKDLNKEGDSLTP